MSAQDNLHIDPQLDNDDRRVHERKYQIKTLWGIGNEVIRRTAVGQKPLEIAEALGITTATVGYIINSELGKSAIMTLQDEMNGRVVDVGVRIRELAPDALKLIEDVIKYSRNMTPEEKALLGGEVPELKLRIATSMDLLDRAGHGAIKRVIGAIAHGIVDRQFIDDIKERSRASRLSLDKAENAEVVE